MKREIVMLSLMGGLMIGLWGCGSSGTALPSEPVAEVGSENASAYATEEILPEVWYTADDLLEMWDAGILSKEKVVEMAEAGQMNDATCREMISYIEQEERYAAIIELIRTSDEGWSVDDLVELYYAGVIWRDEVMEMAEAGEFSEEISKDFLFRIGWDEESIAQFANNLYGGNSVGNVDVAGLLTTHVVEFKDYDGYELRETIQLSPIFTEDDIEIAYALWGALGNDTSSFPSEESLYNTSYLLREMRDSFGCNELEYIIGTYALENLTDGFPITSDNPRSYQGALSTKQVSAFDEEHDSNASHFINVRSVSVVMYLDGATYYGEGNSTILSKAKMYSDTWGPCTFIIALPNGSTPNLPDGYRYDKTLILSTGMCFTDEYDPITLKYYTKEVE